MGVLGVLVSFLGVLVSRGMIAFTVVLGCGFMCFSRSVVMFSSFAVLVFRHGKSPFAC